jgi:hypothetical protein
MKDTKAVRFVGPENAVEIPGAGVVTRGQAVTLNTTLAEELLARGGWEPVKGGKTAGGE